MSDLAHKCYSKHASMKSVKTNKIGKNKSLFEARKGINKNKVQLFHEVYMQLLMLKGN